MSVDDIHEFAAERGWGKPIIFDSFAGGGGASEGIKQALGRSPDYAINHSKPALMLHEANHPETIHLSENVYKVDPLQHFCGKHIGLAWFSPDCKHFSKAKGGKPVERNIRDLCWIIPGWIERIQKSGGKVDVVIMENVEEFWDYGPLMMTDRGLMPDPARKGETRQKWCRSIRKLGGRIEKRELRACDYGAGTIRKRLFIIIRFDGQPIVWPKPTHAAPDDRDVLAGRKLPWVTAADNIDWSLICPSIFDTAEGIMEMFGLKAIRPLADKTMARIARGISRYVVHASSPYLVGVPDRSETFTVASPIVTAAQQGGSSRPAISPIHTITASSKDQNCVAAAFVAQHNNDNRRDGGVNPGRPATAPLSTITQRGTQQNVVSAFVSRQFGTSTGHAADQPLATTTADGGGKSAVVAPHLCAYYGVDQDTPTNEPMHTLTTKPRFGHVEAVIDVPPFTASQAARARQVADLLRQFDIWDEREFVTFEIDGTTLVIVDIGMRMLTPRELYSAQGFPKDYRIDGAFEAANDNGSPVWVPFPKKLQVSCVGNSVSPPVAKALVAANCSHLAEQEEKVAA